MYTKDYAKTTTEAFGAGDAIAIAPDNGGGIHYDPDEVCTAAMYKDDENERSKFRGGTPYWDVTYEREIVDQLRGKYKNMVSDFAEALGEKYKYMSMYINPFRYGEPCGGLTFHRYRIAYDACERVQNEINCFVRTLSHYIGSPLLSIGNHVVTEINAENVHHGDVLNWQKVMKVLPTLDVSTIEKILGLLEEQERAVIRWGDKSDAPMSIP